MTKVHQLLSAFKGLGRGTNLLALGGAVLLLLATIIFATFYNNASKGRPGTADIAAIRNAHDKLKAALSVGDGDDPFARFTWEQRRLASPKTGNVPPDMRLRELAFARQLRQAKGQQGSNENLDSLEWVMRGPSNIGGRTRAFAADVSNPNVLIAGGVSGGIWRSEDGGNSWTKVSTINEHQGVTCLVQDTRPGHTQTWYYGTGEGYGNSASGTGTDSYYMGDGIYKSEDNGLTWTVLGATDNGVPNNFTDVFQIIWNMATDPSNATQNEVYAATYGTIKRSVNGGQSWVTELGSINSASYFTNIAVSSTGVVYAALSSDGTNAGIWRSENGQDWTQIKPADFPNTNHSFDRMAIGINPSNENEVYFLVANTIGAGKTTYDFQNDAEYNSLWRYNYLSGNGTAAGGTWTDLSENLPIGPHPFDDFVAQGGYDLLVAVKPDDPNTVFIGGTNIYRSTDGFTTPNNITFMGGYNETTELPLFTLYPVHHPDQHVLFFHPQNPNVMFSGNDGGLYKTDNCMAENVVWQNINHGYVTTQLYTVAVDKSLSNNLIIGGLQDNGTRYVNTTDPDQPWTMPFNYDGSFCAVPSGRDYMIMSINGGAIVKVQVNDEGQMAAFERIDPVGAENFQFINPFIVDPVNNDIIYLSEGANLWVNTDVSAIPINNVWEKKTQNWFKNVNRIADTTQFISALGASTVPTGRLYLGTSEKRVYKIENALDPTSPMIDITPTSGFPTLGYVNCVEVDPRNADKVFVVFSNYDVYSVFYSVDAGATWQKVAGNLEQYNGGTGNGPSVRSISVLPINADSTSYFLGTSTGLYHTSLLDTLDTEWTPVGLESIGTTVVEMVITRELDKLVVVGTHGNGVFTANTPADPPIGINQPSQSGNIATLQAHFYPNPIIQNGNTHIALDLPRNAPALILTIYNAAGQVLKTLDLGAQTAGSHQIPLNLSYLNTGLYFYSLTANNTKVSGRFMVSK